VEERLEATFEHHADAIAITEQRTGIVLDANDAMSRLLGVERDDLLGRPIDALPHWEAADVVPLLRRLSAGDEAVDGVPVRVQADAAETRECVMSSTVLVRGPEPRRLWTLRDVTDQLRASDELREEYEALARSVTEQARALAQARAHLAQADQEISDVADSLSRELRTPLRQVVGHTGMLREALRHGRFAEASSYADQIEGSTQRLDGMVAALIGLARAGHGDGQSAVDMTALALKRGPVSASDPGTWSSASVASAGQRRCASVLVLWENLLSKPSSSPRCGHAKGGGRRFLEEAGVVRSPTTAPDSMPQAGGCSNLHVRTGRMSPPALSCDSLAASSVARRPDPYVAPRRRRGDRVHRRS
jgi:PAS domain S-box-containing protein